MADTLTPVAQRPWSIAPRPAQRRTERPATGPINVDNTERWLSTLGGGALALYGLSRGTWAGLGMALAGGALVYRGATGHCQIYQALGLNTAASRHGPATVIPAGHGVKVEKAITINRSPEELFHFWRNFENLPRFMTHLKSVRVTSPTQSHWVAEAPPGQHRMGRGDLQRARQRADCLAFSGRLAGRYRRVRPLQPRSGRPRHGDPGIPQV
jgi:uncharacterized membrane protein